MADTYTVTWRYEGCDGELPFNSEEEAEAFTCMFHDWVEYNIIKDTRHE